MMALSLRERVVNNVITTLKTVHMSTHNNTFVNVVHSPIDPFTSSVFPAVGVYIIGGNLSFEDVPIGSTRDTIRLAIEVYKQIRVNVNVDALNMLQDIESVMMADPTRGGLANRTLPISYNIFYTDVNNVPLSGIQYMFDVVATYTTTNP